MAISMLKIRRPLGRLIFNMGIAIPGKTVFLIETAPWWLQTPMAHREQVTKRYCIQTLLTLMIDAYNMIPTNLNLQFLIVFKFRHLIWMNIENKSIAQYATHCTPWHRTSDQNIEEEIM